MFYILLKDNETRNTFMNELRKKEVNSVFHYIPLHSAPFGIKLGNKEGDLPVTENISGRLLRLPLYAGINAEELEYLLSCLEIEFKHYEKMVITSLSIPL
jgi:dTDP-4-amino-4,6-dideoxygalactose transaminase